jgi:hypothetical protein
MFSPLRRTAPWAATLLAAALTVTGGPPSARAETPPLPPLVACLDVGPEGFGAALGPDCGARGVPLEPASGRARLLGLVDLKGEARSFLPQVGRSRLPETLPPAAQAPAALLVVEAGTPGTPGSRSSLILIGREGETSVVLGDVLLHMRGEHMDLDTIDLIHLEQAADQDFLDLVSYRTAVPVEGPGMPGPPEQHRLRWVEGRYQVVGSE